MAIFTIKCKQNKTNIAAVISAMAMARSKAIPVDPTVTTLCDAKRNYLPMGRPRR